MKTVRCTNRDQICWYCSKEQRQKCQRVLEDNYHRPARAPHVTMIIQKRLVWGE